MSTITGPNGIAYYRLASLKGMITLESKGLSSRAGPLRRKIAQEFNLKPRDGYDKYIAAIKAKMEELLAATKEET